MRRCASYIALTTQEVHSQAYVKNDLWISYTPRDTQVDWTGIRGTLVTLVFILSVQLVGYEFYLTFIQLTLHCDVFLNINTGLGMSTFRYIMLWCWLPSFACYKIYMALDGLVSGSFQERKPVSNTKFLLDEKCPTTRSLSSKIWWLCLISDLRNKNP